MMGPIETYLLINSRVLNDGPIYGESLKFKFGPNDFCGQERIEFDSIYDKAFYERTLKKCFKYGKELTWREWLTESGFPVIKYKYYKNNLIKLSEHLKIMPLRLMGKNDNHSFFYHLCTPVVGLDSYLDYLLDSWRGNIRKSQPIFYFSIFDSSWVLNDFIRNKTQPKTIRTSFACCMAISFRWLVKENIPMISFIMRNNNLDHLYEDIFSPMDILGSICDELAIPKEGIVSLYSVSTMKGKFIDSERMIMEAYK